MIENNNDAFNELKEIRKKQYEESVLRKRQLLNKKKESKREKESSSINTTEESQPLLEPEPIRDDASTDIDNSIIDNDNSTSNTSNQNLINERRKNKGFESKDSKILHYLFIIYYYIKTFFNFLNMFFRSLISPRTAAKYADKNKPKKFSSFDTYHKDRKTFDLSYMAHGKCCG